MTTGTNRTCARLAAALVGLALVVVAAAAPVGAQDSGDPTESGDPTPTDVIRAAGNTEDEVERHGLLAELLGTLPVGDPLRTDLESLLPILDRWANGRSDHWVPGDQQFGEQGYLAGFFNFRAHPAEPGRDVFPPRITEGSPLYPIWALYRGRMLIQQSIQTGFIQRDAALRASYQGQGRDLLAAAAEAFPDNRVIRMWLDEPIPWPALAPHPDAPEWANLQREALGKLADVIDFWIDERQAPDGQLGGGWGDDVEIWRRWTPILVGFRSEKVDDAVELLAHGLWDLPRLESGYTSILSDVEHTSEDTGDTLTAMLHIDPTDPVWTQRSRDLATLMRDLWTGRNERDQLQFTSVYFTGTDVAPDELFACDTPYHTRAVQPALLLWQRTRDPALTELFTDWLDTWVDATARDENGKPAGAVPAAIRWPTGEIGGPLPDWWDPGCAISIDQGLYEWPSQVSAKLRSLVLAFWVTDEDRYLEPLRSMAELRRTHLAETVPDPTPGSEAWAASRMGRSLTAAIAKYRLITGDTGFDDLLLAEADPYTRFRLTGDDTEMVAALDRLVAAFRINREAVTTEVRWTDRLFSFPSEYANHWIDPPLPVIRPDLLYRMVTGDLGDALYLPLNAVRWRTEPRDIAIIVDSHGPTALEARLFHFGDQERSVGAELLVLAPDTYRWDLSCAGSDAEETLSEGTLTVGTEPPVVDLRLPAGRECALTVGIGSDPAPVTAPTNEPEPDEPDADGSDADGSERDEPDETTPSTDDDGEGSTEMIALLGGVAGVVALATTIVVSRRRKRRTGIVASRRRESGLR